MGWSLANCAGARIAKTKTHQSFFDEFSESSSGLEGSDKTNEVHDGALSLSMRFAELQFKRFGFLVSLARLALISRLRGKTGQNNLFESNDS